MKRIDPGNLLVIGKVLKPWGLRGMVRVASYAESPDTFLRLGQLYVQAEQGFRVLEVEEVREHRRGVLLKFRHLDRIEDVEGLAGFALYGDKTAFPPLEDGEYYWHELIGMEVWTDTGKLVGRLEAILRTGSNDVYVVRKNGREELIPAIRDVIREVDVSGARMIIHPIEGLLGEDDL